MATLEAAHIFGVQIRESADDGSDFSNADTDYRILFVGEDGLFHLKDSAGGISTPTGMADPMTTGGDLIYRNGSNVTARLAKGAAGGMLSQYNGVLAWNSGTSFPASPASGNRYWRSDLGLEFYYDGTRWLSTELFSEAVQRIDGNTWVISATSSAGWWWPIPNNGGADIWVVSVEADFIVASGGSALSGSHKWVGTVDRANSGTNIGTLNIDSGASNSYRNVSATVGASIVNGQYFVIVTWTKTGSPGNLTAMTRINYRLIAT